MGIGGGPLGGRDEGPIRSGGRGFEDGRSGHEREGSRVGGEVGPVGIL